MGQCEEGQVCGQFRKLKSLIPFLECQGFVIKRGVDHLVIYPDPNTATKKSDVEFKFDGEQVFKNAEAQIKKYVVSSVDAAIKRFESVKKSLED